MLVEPLELAEEHEVACALISVMSDKHVGISQGQFLIDYFLCNARWKLLQEHNLAS